jgi:hypothetical protein
MLEYTNASNKKFKKEGDVKWPLKNYK